MHSEHSGKIVMSSENVACNWHCVMKMCGYLKHTFLSPQLLLSILIMLNVLKVAGKSVISKGSCFGISQPHSLTVPRLIVLSELNVFLVG